MLNQTPSARRCEMMYATSRRIHVLTRCLRKPDLVYNNVRAYISSKTVAIGGVAKDVTDTKQPQYVPKHYYNDNVSQSTLHHLQWMMQKDLLKQDIFLLGPPGPRRRSIAMQYLELTNREHEYVALSRDTTESDLKQRREIMQGTALYFDQSAVRAAIEGRVLVLEGIEKAERNVLPVLNNLLENREMHLEDGRLLIPAERYDKLLQQYSKEDLDNWKLVRVNEDFRVIALGLPVPRYRGNPLDPPLRSRFQARDVNVNNYQEWLQELMMLAPHAPRDKIEQMLSVAFGMLSKEASVLGMPDFPIDSLPTLTRILSANPDLPVYNLLYRLYPYRIFMKEGIKQLEDLWQSFQVAPPPERGFALGGKLKEFLNALKHHQRSVDGYIETDYQNRLLEEMLQTCAVADFCIIGTRGCGKSILVQQIAEMLGKRVESIVLYQDMTSRDLIQQRTTLDNGDTVWKLSPLIEAAMAGRIAILDGLHRIHPSTLSILHRLVHDREIQLHDGKRLISAERFDALQKEFGLTEEQLIETGVLRIHPEFRIVAIADPPQLGGSANWLSPEVLSLFAFHEVRPLTKQEEMHIMVAKYGPISRPLHQIIDLAHTLRDNPDQTLRNLAGHLSTRQLLRIAARMQRYPADDAWDTVEKTFMIRFLPSLARDALEKTMRSVGIHQTDALDKPITWSSNDGVVTIGQTSIPLYKTTSHTKVPNVLFYDVPQHITLMERLLQDFQLGYHLLLVGNQGVGKNKIIDRFLELLNRPREYIQLHRDTTVQTLTIQPTVRDGLLVHEDSPLVKAIKTGHVLVIDEADKAPTHVTCILKTLVETGQMILSDGRRIVKNGGEQGPECIQTHPDFRIIVLANRPGFPFLGNDFFGSLGDLFSSHAVDNPTKQSEIDMLRQYGPDVPIDLIKRLVVVFGELRDLADQGLVNYPYSTREVVNIVKHMQQFPGTDIEDVVFNVFDFDRYSPEMVDTLGQILFKHGFSSQNVFASEYIKSKRAKEFLKVTTKDRVSGLDTTAPKHGKVDEKNEPHVGGNTWAGGTGGRDTAGLGGKGGPYRLDAGHIVHQLSDAEKAAVPEHIQRAAREMGRKAFEEKLKEIGMSSYDANLYTQFSSAVQRQVQSLRMILSTLQAKNKERQWNRHQTTGELDDVKLIDGILGEKNIYRRRKENDPELGTPQMKPKHFRLVVDVSGSMYRFNSYDGRLDRELEAVVLVMEAFEGFDDKIQYDIIGHSGETDKIQFVKRGQPPKNNKERLDIIRIMHAHSQFCWAGDNTLEATEIAVNSMVDEDSDENIVIVLSDANLQRYGIPASRLGKALTAQDKVNAYAIFIGSLGDQAERLVVNLPAGHGYVCTDLTKLPQILKQIFSSSLMASSAQS